MSNNTPAAASSSTSAASRANYDNQGGGTGGSSNSASSSWRMNSSTSHTFSHDNKGKLEESDEDMFTVPDVEAPQLPAQLGDMADSSIITKNNNNTTTSTTNNKDEQTNGKRRRGRNPVDREHRRLKRLLRNRVSAQQARERKKVYVSDLESRATELQDINSKLEEKISTLMNENTMLRKVLLNTRPKADESNEPNP